MNNVFMNTYKRFPVSFVKGEGSWLFDSDGNKYLDFTSGIAVNCLGHNFKPLVSAISKQAANIIHTSNYYLSDVSEAFAQKIVDACASSGMKKVFLGNSGVEAIEGAIKIARKYSLKKYGTGRHQIITLRGSFHGRTITGLSATGQDQFHKDFGPFTEGFNYVASGDIDALDKALDKNTVAALLIEPVQGESGIHIQSKEFIDAAARLCSERDILLMFDEIQCGLGRTGTFLACEQFGVLPDIVTLAKGICGGVPAGVVLAGEKAMDVFEPGDHGSTFGGNPLAAAAGLVILETVSNPSFLAEISRKGKKILSSIKAFNHSSIKEIRGIGLMLGIDIDREAGPILGKAISRSSSNNFGLLLLSAGKNTLRLLPPYTISDDELDQGL